MPAYERLYAYDVVRVIAMFFVVAVHSLMVVDVSWATGSLYVSALQALFFTANALFFLLSGKFNLRERKGDDDLKRYYLKRARNFLLPILVLFFVRTLYNLAPNFGSVGNVFKSFAINTLGAFNSMEYWFVFSLFGFLLSAPFVAGGFSRLTVFGKKCFAGIGLGYSLFVTLFSNLGIDFGWGNLFGGFAFAFFLGAFVDEVAQHRRATAILGIVGLVSYLANVTLVTVGWGVNAFDLSPLYTLTAVALYVTILRVFRDANPSKVVSYLAKHSFSVYLIHMMVLMPLAHSLPQFMGVSSIGAHVGVTIAVFGITLALAIIVDTVLVKPCQKLFDVVVKAISSTGEKQAA